MASHRFLSFSVFLMLFLLFPIYVQACQTPFQVGYQTIQVPGGPMVAVWYPTSDVEENFAYSKDFSSHLALHGRPNVCSRFPLVVFSHGFNGCGVQSTFLTEMIARMGYVVVAPDHSDALFCHIGKKGGLKWNKDHHSLLEPDKWTERTEADRREDIRKVLDWTISDSPWAKVIDATKIAGMGHSLGGYTILGMMGGWPSWKDARIKAGLLLSPYMHPFMKGGRLNQVRGPIMYQGASFDFGVTPFIEGREGAFSMGSNRRYYVKIRGENHFSWSNLICAGTKTVHHCYKKKPNAKLMLWYGIGFLDAHLKGDSSALGRLNGTGLEKYLVK